MRQQHVFITSFGRNVSPEWIECELSAERGIAQVAVFGEGRPWNVAVIVPASMGGEPFDAIATAVRRANERLPDYARIGRWLFADTPFAASNALATANGRLRRDRIEELYRTRIDSLYQSEVSLVS